MLEFFNGGYENIITERMIVSVYTEFIYWSFLFTLWHDDCISKAQKLLESCEKWNCDKNHMRENRI